MAFRILVPYNFVMPEMLANIESVCKERGIDLIKTDEKTCIDQFLLNRGSLALLSPLGYGAGVKSADFRIIPTYAAALLGYSGRASLYFKSGLTTLDKIGTQFPDDFLMKIGNILLAERYEMETELELCKGSVADILGKYSAAMAYGTDSQFNSMDISEDWFETFDIPLPVGVWVCRNQEEPEDVLELTKLFAMDELPQEIELPNHENEYNLNNEREGRLMTIWDDDMKSAFEQTLELLYYHKLLPELPAIKIY
jgi:hypothetical protein